MMDRRTFARSFLGGLGACATTPLLSPAILPLSGAVVSDGGMAGGSPIPSRVPKSHQDTLRVNADRLLDQLLQLSRFGSRPDGGVDRVAFSDAELEAREFVASLMADAGLELRVDAAGNLFGRSGGSEPGLPPLMVGSHIDSVPAGGNYDGALGTLAALEAVHRLREGGVGTRHPVDVVVFTNEEGGKTGSRALAGQLEEGELNLVTASGHTIAQGIRRLGGDPTRLKEVRARPGSVAGFLELHVEQGGVLEMERLQIGVVEGIVGIRRWNTVVTGAANHAGTTPMDQRHDALLAGSLLVAAVNRVARSMAGSQVATVGKIEAFPGAPNVIPGEVRLTVEIRALSMDRIDDVFHRVAQMAEAIDRENGTRIEFEEFYVSEAAPTDLRFRQWVEDSARELGLSWRRMPSGAGHDAQAVARIAPVGMVFVPSIGGLSHHPDEYSRPEDVEAGANVLLRSLLRADRTLQDAGAGGSFRPSDAFSPE